MNQCRCETCKHLDDDEGKAACNSREEWISEDIWNWIKVVGCASHSDFQFERDKVLVYSRIIKPPVNFPSITRRELALKDFEDNDAEQSWTSLNFKLKNGDEVRVYRSTKGGERE